MEIPSRSFLLGISKILMNEYSALIRRRDLPPRKGSETEANVNDEE